MEFTDENKRKLLKSCADIIKDFRGVGPQSHYIKYYDKEIHLTVIGTLTKIEKYFFNTHGQEYIDAIYKFYLHGVKASIHRLDQLFMSKYKFELLAWEPDFLNDKIVYKIKHI